MTRQSFLIKRRLVPFSSRMFQTPLASGYNSLVPELSFQCAFGPKPFESSIGWPSPAPAVSGPRAHCRKGRSMGRVLQQAIVSKLCDPFLQRIKFLKWCNQWCSNVKNYLCAQLNLPVCNQCGSGWVFPNCANLAQGSCILSMEDCVDKMPSAWDHGAQTLCSLQTSHRFILFLPADRKLHSS